MSRGNVDSSPLKVVLSKSDLETREVGASLAQELREGDLLLLHGELGSGKTTLIRGLIHAAGFDGEVRSPTFNLIQLFDTDPPILHADLYRLKSTTGLGLEDYLDTHLCVVEWPERAPWLLADESALHVYIDFDGEGRKIFIGTSEELKEQGFR